MNYENTSAAKYAYENRNTNDNILKRKLKTYESKACLIVNYILKNTNSVELLAPNYLKQQKIDDFLVN
ncbi:hypothetical protein [Staphylococcus shinii]|uniref:hypothetical protein n=1 Tax=Staphylococcus shinii TaxID=2912228 RepID=UPI003CF07F4B